MRVKMFYTSLIFSQYSQYAASLRLFDRNAEINER